ncbi:MAG: nicotinate-nucleotide--dimethylbenzimidazole phosphoribosyltransferase [Kofleriaceae bacterium]
MERGVSGGDGAAARSEILAATVAAIEPAPPVASEGPTARWLAARLAAARGESRRAGDPEATPARPAMVIAVDGDRAAAAALCSGEAAATGLATDAGALTMVVWAGPDDAEVPAEALRLDGDDGGVALAVALAAEGVDVIGLGAVGGGPALAVLTGVILGAASVRVPVVLGDAGAAAAAVAALGLAPAVAGYLTASHGGGDEPAARALRAAGVPALFEVGLGGEGGAGAGLALALVTGPGRGPQGPRDRDPVR